MVCDMLAAHCDSTFEQPKGTQMVGDDVSFVAAVVVFLLLILVLAAASVKFILFELANVQRGIPKSLNGVWS